MYAQKHGDFKIRYRVGRNGGYCSESHRYIGNLYAGPNKTQITWDWTSYGHGGNAWVSNWSDFGTFTLEEGDTIGLTQIQYGEGCGNGSPRCDVEISTRSVMYDLGCGLTEDSLICGY